MPDRTGKDIKVYAVIFGPLLLLFMVLSAFQYHNYTNNRLRVRRQLERRQDIETELAATKLQSYVREITYSVDRLSNSLGSSKKDTEKYEGMVRAFDFLGGKVERLIYFDKDGNKVYSVTGKGTLKALPDNCRYREFFVEPKMTMVPYLSPIEKSEDGEEVIFFSYPVKNAGTGEFSGVVMAQAGRSSFAGICKRINEIDPDIRFTYYGQKGDRVCLDSCVRGGCSHARKELMSDKAASEVVAAEGPGYSGGLRVAYYPVRIEGYSWYMTSEMPLSLVEGLASGDTMRYSAAGAIFVFSLVAGGLYFRRVYIAKSAAEMAAAQQASVVEKNRAIEAERDKLLAVLNGVPDGIILLDGEGHVMDANSSIRKMSGSPADASPRNITDAPVPEVFLGPLDGPVERTSGDRTYRVIPVPVGESEDGVLKEVRVVRDISVEKSVERKRKEMVSMITHDIKNPLAAIIGMSEWLTKDKVVNCLGDDGIAAVEAINSSATRILALSDTLLLSAGEGSHKLEKTPVDIETFLEKVIAEFYLEAKRKGVSIRHGVNEISAVMQIDEQQMTRAFSNIINHSLRHTPEGGEIAVTTKDFRDYITVSISDTGPAISKSDLPHVFQKNYTVSDGKKSTRKTGLGLSIAKSIIEAHGGTIEFVSDERSAAMFVVRLPITSHA